MLCQAEEGVRGSVGGRLGREARCVLLIIREIPDTCLSIMWVR